MVEDISEVEARRKDAEQPEPFEYGVGVCIMPVRDGWKVEYFSAADFEREPGTTYPSLEGVLQSVREVLLGANTDEERATARALEEILWAQLHNRAPAPSSE